MVSKFAPDRTPIQKNKGAGTLASGTLWDTILTTGLADQVNGAMVTGKDGGGYTYNLTNGAASSGLNGGNEPLFLTLGQTKAFTLITGVVRFQLFK